MYEAFNKFLDRPSWYTPHADEEENFYCALRTVVTNPNFNPEEMGDYFDKSPARLKILPEVYQEARRRYVRAAWAVKRYLKAQC